MRVAIVNELDIRGGAARAAYRLHTGLGRIGVDSRMVVNKKLSNDKNVYYSNGRANNLVRKIRAFLDQLPLRLYNKQNTPFHIGWFGENILKDKRIKEADIINLHWVVSGFLSINSISRLAKLSKPVVWTLHDMWAFTGGCHYSGSCEKYVTSCGGCPQLNSDKVNDITRAICRRKKKAYRELHLTIVTPSKWLAGCAKRSELLSGFRIVVIPNSVDTDIFKPEDKSTSRDTLGLPQNKNIILSGGVNIATIERKGFLYLKKAINKLVNMQIVDKDKLCLVIFGTSDYGDTGEYPLEVKFLGELLDDSSLCMAYSAADVFVIPSLQDNLPNTVMESLSCGTPVVGFNIGGISEMIEHQKNGYLSLHKDPDSLAEGIKWILEDRNRASRLGEFARKKAVKSYHLEIQAKRYMELFEKLINKVI